jgi:NAD(P)H-dependent FMN reductase
MALREALCAQGATVTSVSPADFLTRSATIPAWGEGGADHAPSAWREVVAATDSFVFVLPEYNHSFPGEWKLLIDSLSKDYRGKRAYLVGVSNGTFGGARMMMQVVPILVYLGFSIAPERLYVSKVHETYAEGGTPVDADAQLRLNEFVAAMLAV